MTFFIKKLPAAAFIGLLTLAALGCSEPGPFEQAGEEIDEAADTLKNGKESAATKLDDAADEVRDGVNDAADKLKKD